MGFEALEKGYGRLLNICLNNREITLAIAAATIVLAFALYPLVPQEMMPLGDSGQFVATIELEAGASFECTDRVAQQFESILLEQPEVEKVSSNVGFEITRNSTYFSGYSMGSVNTAFSVVTLKDLNERDRDESGRRIRFPTRLRFGFDG